MAYILELLNSPQSVGWVQYHLGIRWRYPDKKQYLHPEKNKVCVEEDHVDIHYPMQYWLARASSHLAGEPFYHVFYPACAWLFEMHLARRNILMLSLMMYIGQGLKDILKQPRPSSPPVIRLESTYTTEYGMPSTHSVLGVTVPYSFLLFLSYSYQIPPVYYNYAMIWSALVVSSRIYLGMHTIMQVLAGVAIPAFSINFLAPYIIKFDEFQLNGSDTCTGLITAAMFFMSGLLFFLDNTIDPQTNTLKWTTSRGDTAEILGWCSGFLVGSRWIHFNPPVSDVPTYLQEYFIESPAFHCLFRFITGALILGPGTLLIRKVFCHLFIVVNGVRKQEIFRSKKLRLVEWPYKFLSVFTSAVIATCVIPTAFRKIGLW